MKVSRLFLVILLSTSCFALIGCSNSSDTGNTNPDYFSIQGTIKNDKHLSIPPAAKLYVVWSVSSSSPDHEYIFGGGSINTSNNTFSISFTAPPPADALNSNYLGVGFIFLSTVSYPEGIVDRSLSDPTKDTAAFWGIINDRAIIYLNGNPQLSHDWVKDFHTHYNFGKGWYNPNPGFDGFTPDSGPIELLIKPDSIQFPNWT